MMLFFYNNFVVYFNILFLAAFISQLFFIPRSFVSLVKIIDHFLGNLRPLKTIYKSFNILKSKFLSETNEVVDGY
jgi:uncharacterized membrane protein